MQDSSYIQFASQFAVDVSVRHNGSVRTGRKCCPSGLSAKAVASSPITSPSTGPNSAGYAGASFKLSPPAELVPFPDFDAVCEFPSSRRECAATMDALCPKLKEIMQHISDFNLKQSVISQSDVSTSVGSRSDIDALSEASYAEGN